MLLHLAILKTVPEANSVIHCHPRNVLVFCAHDASMLPVILLSRGIRGKPDAPPTLDVLLLAGAEAFGEEFGLGALANAGGAAYAEAA